MKLLSTALAHNNAVLLDCTCVLFAEAAQISPELAAQFCLHAGTTPSGQDTFSVGGAPPPGTSAVEVPVSTSTAITGAGVPTPAPVSLPPGTAQQTCEQFQSVCISSESSAAPFEFTVTLTCLPGNSAQVGPQSKPGGLSTTYCFHAWLW